MDGSLWQHFTQGAKRSIKRGCDEAMQSDQDHVGVEVLLIGIVVYPKMAGSALLEAMGFSEAALGVVVEQLRTGLSSTAVAPATSAAPVCPPFDEDAKSIMVMAEQESRQLGAHYIGTEHLLLGMLRRKTKVRTILERNGVTYAAAREVLQTWMASGWSAVQQR